MTVTYIRALYSGRVQGVGFRYQTRELAQGYEVAGYVRNLSDGRVELEIEGEKQELEAFLEELAQAMSGYIKGVERSEGKREAIHKGFSIVR